MSQLQLDRPFGPDYWWVADYCQCPAVEVEAGVRAFDVAFGDNTQQHVDGTPGASGGFCCCSGGDSGGCGGGGNRYRRGGGGGRVAYCSIVGTAVVEYLAVGVAAAPVWNVQRRTAPDGGAKTFRCRCLGDRGGGRCRRCCAHFDGLVRTIFAIQKSVALKTLGNAVSETWI